jgi:hypothetical protein
MSNNTGKKQDYQAVLARVKKEMAEPRVAESAQMESKAQHTAAVKEAANS